MKRLFFLLAAMAVAYGSWSQTASDPVMFEIDGQAVRQSEFRREFLRSIGQDPKAAPTACTYEKRQALEDYVTLFVNFRTKLANAHAQGLDTAASLRKELASYRDELAAPFLIDSATIEALMHEAYRRNGQAVHAAHILVQMEPTATPDDTLRAYKKAQSIYQRLTQGEDFFKVAREVMEEQMNPEQLERLRQTPNAEGHEGDLGFFTVFDMIYPFETAAYTIAAGTIGEPLRTQYGYHIIKVFERVPYYGKTTLRHIWTTERGLNNRAEARIRAAYKSLQEGTPFERVAHNYSDDRSTSANGGLLGTMAMQQLPPEYVSLIATRQMKAGDYSEPFHTEYGWHIIMVEQRDTLPPYDEMKPTYRQRLSHDQRNASSRAAFAEQSKRRYNFIDYTRQYGKWEYGKDSVARFVADKKVTSKSRYASSLEELTAQLATTVFSKRWVFVPSAIKRTEPLFAIGDRTFNAIQLGQYIAMTQTYEPQQDLAAYAQKKYEQFVEAEAIRYADSRLEEDNADFRNLLDEYRNGLVIFNYNEKMIWSRALNDTAGFDAFCKQYAMQRSADNPEDSNYYWNRRARVTIYTVADSGCLTPDKALKAIAKGQKKKLSASDMRLNLVEMSDSKKCTSDTPVAMSTVMLEEGHQDELQTNEWKTGTYVHPKEKGYAIYVVEQVLPVMLKSMGEARGYYMTEYQNQIERQLIEQLRKKYNVVIHQDVIDAFTY